MVKSQDPEKQDLFAALSEYWPLGPKDEEYTEYQKLKYIRESLEYINNEQVEEFSICLGKLLKWIELALELRIEDVTARR